jgi:hypothetical protein
MFAAESIENAQKTQADNYNRNVKESKYMQGDLVMVNIPIMSCTQNDKLDHKWYGAYRVISVDPPTADIRLANDTSSEIRKLHFNRLKPCAYPRVMPFVNQDPLSFSEEADPNVEQEEESDEVTDVQAKLLRNAENVVDAKKRLFQPVNETWQQLQARKCALKIVAHLSNENVSEPLMKPKRCIDMPQENVSFYAAIAYLLSGDDMKHDKVRKRAADFCRTELKNRWSKVFEESCENSNVFKESATVTYKEILLIAAWLSTDIIIFSNIWKGEKRIVGNG